MYQTIRTFIRPEIKIADLIFENPYLLLLLEHFNLDLVMHDKTVSQICRENEIDENTFILFANLYNGYSATGIEKIDYHHIETIIHFLNNSHQYFKNDKYPEIQGYISNLLQTDASAEIKMIGYFFNDYFMEVTEHLNYEEKVAFPYFRSLLKTKIVEDAGIGLKFSSTEYLEHHTDIESKLTDLKNLLLKHISLKNSPELRRKLIFSLIELEYVLNIHSIIEEEVLIPLVINREKEVKIG